MKRNKSVKDMIKKALHFIFHSKQSKESTLTSSSGLTRGTIRYGMDTRNKSEYDKKEKSFSCLTRESIMIGRSMTEMLGVLAIIGMLSIGGLYALRIAFTRYNTNNLIEDVKLAGFVIVDELFDQLPDDDEGMNMAGKFEQKTAYTFKAFAEEDTTFEIMVQGVPYNVCQELKKRKVDWLEEIRANGIPNTCYENDTNQISFFFNTELGEYPELEENTCRSDRDCPLVAPHCRNGICTKCEEGMELNDGSCTSCPVGNERKYTIANYCHSCGENYFLGRYNECLECNAVVAGRDVPKNREECGRCANRCWDEENSTCVRTLAENIFNNNGICNYDCTVGQFVMSKDGSWQCATCPVGNERQYTTADYCHVCGENYFLGRYNECLECNAVVAGRDVPKNREECGRCANRCWDEENSTCVRTLAENIFNNNGICNYDCTVGQFVMSKDGSWQCATCPVGNERQFTTADYCHVCGENYFLGRYGECFECNASYFDRSVAVIKTECDRCSNRYWDTTQEKCFLCPSGQKANAAGTECVPE